MARNGSGVFVTPNTFVADTPIVAADHNENWTDAATEITNSLALDGQSTMTGQIKAADGSSGTPGISFGSDPDLGIFRDSANTLGVNASGGVKVNGVALVNGIARAWASVTVATLTLDASHNVTSVTKTSAGRFVLTVTTVFSSAFWVPMVIANNGAGTELFSAIRAVAAGTVDILFVDSTGSRADPANFYFVGFGLQ